MIYVTTTSYLTCRQTSFNCDTVCLLHLTLQEPVGARQACKSEFVLSVYFWLNKGEMNSENEIYMIRIILTAVSEHLTVANAEVCQSAEHVLAFVYTFVCEVAALLVVFRVVQLFSSKSHPVDYYKLWSQSMSAC